MAKTPAERKREQREREEKALLPLADSSYDHLSSTFSDHVAADPNWSDFEIIFEILGYEPPDFSEDRGPEDFANDVAFSSDEDKLEVFKGSRGSIGRAEVMTDLLFDAAMHLATSVNRFKVKELKAKLQTLQETPFSDPADQKAAFETAAQINRILDELGKSQRFNAPKWRVKGV